MDASTSIGRRLLEGDGDEPPPPSEERRELTVQAAHDDYSTYHYHQTDGVPRQAGFFRSYDATAFPRLVDTSHEDQRKACMVYSAFYQGTGDAHLGNADYYACNWYGKQPCPAQAASAAPLIDHAPGNICNNHYDAANVEPAELTIPPVHTVAEGILRKQKYRYDGSTAKVRLKTAQELHLMAHENDEYMYAPRQCSKGDAPGWIVDKATPGAAAWCPHPAFCPRLMCGQPNCRAQAEATKQVCDAGGACAETTCLDRMLSAYDNLPIYTEAEACNHIVDHDASASSQPCSACGITTDAAVQAERREVRHAVPISQYHNQYEACVNHRLFAESGCMDELGHQYHHLARSLFDTTAEEALHLAHAQGKCSAASQIGPEPGDEFCYTLRFVARPVDYHPEPRFEIERNVTIFRGTTPTIVRGTTIDEAFCGSGGKLLSLRCTGADLPYNCDEWRIPVSGGLAVLQEGFAVWELFGIDYRNSLRLVRQTITVDATDASDLLAPATSRRHLSVVVTGSNPGVGINFESPPAPPAPHAPALAHPAPAPTQLARRLDAGRASVHDDLYDRGDQLRGGAGTGQRRRRWGRGRPHQPRVHRRSARARAWKGARAGSSRRRRPPRRTRRRAPSM